MAEPSAPELSATNLKSGEKHGNPENHPDRQQDSRPNNQPKQLSRRSLWSNILNRIKDAIPNEPEFPLLNQRTEKRLITRREMLVMLGISAGGSYIATHQLPELIDSIITGEITSPKDYDPTLEEIKAVEELIKDTKTPEDVDKSGQTVETAKKYGLTLYDYPTLPEHLKVTFKDEHDLDWYVKKDLLDFKTYFDTAKEILALYGVELVLGDDTHSYSYGGRALKPEELDTNVVKKSINRLLDSFLDQPVELIKQTGLKKVGLIKLVTAGGYAETNSSHDTYYVDPTQERSDNPFDHEIYHLYDVNKGGRYFLVDKSFNALNPSDLPYTDFGKKNRSNKYISYAEYSTDIDNLTDDARSGDPTLGSTPSEISVSLQKRIDNDAQKVATVSNYSFAHIAEDKAELGKILFNPAAYAFVLDERKPILRKKFIFLLARLYHDNPNLVKYFLEVRNQVMAYESFSLTGGGIKPEDLVTIYP